MQNRLRISFISLCLWLPLAASGTLEARSQDQWARELGMDLNVSYSARRVFTTGSTSIEMAERKAPGKQRMEMNLAGMDGTMIIREDLEKSYFVMPQMGMYRELDLTAARQQSNQDMAILSATAVGQETVFGSRATRYQTQFRDDNGEGSGDVWVSGDGIPVKMDMTYTAGGFDGTRIVMELHDVEVGPQSASWFELPDDVQPLTMGSLIGMTAASGAEVLENSDREGMTEDEKTLTEELTTVLNEEARKGLKEGTRDKIRKGLRGLFN